MMSVVPEAPERDQGDSGVCQLQPINDFNEGLSGNRQNSLHGFASSVKYELSQWQPCHSIAAHINTRTCKAHKHTPPPPLVRLEQSIWNAFMLLDICFAVCHFTNIMAPRSFSRGFHLKPFAIDAHWLFMGALRESDPVSAPTPAITPTS